MYYYYVDTPEQVCTGDSGWTGARSARVESPRNVALGFVRYAVSGVSHGYSRLRCQCCVILVARGNGKQRERQTDETKHQTNRKTQMQQTRDAATHLSVQHTVRYVFYLGMVRARKTERSD